MVSKGHRSVESALADILDAEELQPEPNQFKAAWADGETSITVEGAWDAVTRHATDVGQDPAALEGSLGRHLADVLIHRVTQLGMTLAAALAHEAGQTDTTPETTTPDFTIFPPATQGGDWVVMDDATGERHYEGQDAGMAAATAAGLERGQEIRESVQQAAETKAAVEAPTSTAEIIAAVEAKTGLTIGGDHDKVVLALGYLSSDAMRQEVNDAVWASRKGRRDHAHS